MRFIVCTTLGLSRSHSLESERVRCTGKHSLCILQALDLIGPCIGPELEVLEDEVARAMELCNVGVDVLKLVHRQCPVLLEVHELRLEHGLGRTLVRDALGI